MKKFIYILICIHISLTLMSCATELEEYETVEKPFDIKNYFTGTIIAWGIVQDFTNKVTKRFCVEVIGTWDGDYGTLSEAFYFTGEKKLSYRTWKLRKQENGSYIGTADDVKGDAIGVHKGFAFHFQYDFLLEVDEGSYQVTMDDWMYQLDDYKVINRTSMRKFGLKVADITIFFDKLNSNTRCKTS